MPRFLTGLVFVLGAAAVPLLQLGAGPFPAAFDPVEYRHTPVADVAPRFERRFIFQDLPTPAAHAGTLTSLPDGGLLAAWFGGSREGAGDVAIWGARLHGRDWSEPFVITDRSGSERELGRALRKLGNPVLYRDPDDRLWLFYVTVTLGGWSTSHVSYKRSLDGGRSWEPARRLVTSPFANVSTLVRGRPLTLADGGIALPAYHELAGKFSELIRLSADGQVLAKHRISSGRHAIQPSLVARGPARVVSLMRRAHASPARVLLARSDDAGRHWSSLEATDLANPNASVAALGDADGGLLLAYNPDPLGRGRLQLARSENGRHWRVLAELESGALEDEFSYPFLIRDEAGDYHLIYTWQRERMVHVQFNQAWLESRP